MMTVQPEFTHSMDLPLRLGRRAVQARLDYDSADPHAITLVITDQGGQARWSVDRGLMREGCTRAVGVGDVHVRPGHHDSKVMIRLNNPASRSNGGGDVTFEASRVLISIFVARTYAAVPAGREHEWAPSLDDELAELLGKEERA